jgi:hypothetical protein
MAKRCRDYSGWNFDAFTIAEDRTVALAVQEETDEQMPVMNAYVLKPVEMKVLEKAIRSIKTGGGTEP